MYEFHLQVQYMFVISWFYRWHSKMSLCMIFRSPTKGQSASSWATSVEAGLWRTSASWTGSCWRCPSGCSCQSTLPPPCTFYRESLLGSDKQNNKKKTLPCLAFLAFLNLTIQSCVALQAFLVRRSRTSQRNVLCVRLVDDSVPSFVQQFGVREEHSSESW